MATQLNVIYLVKYVQTFVTKDVCYTIEKSEKHRGSWGAALLHTDFNCKINVKSLYNFQSIAINQVITRRPPLWKTRLRKGHPYY